MVIASNIELIENGIADRNLSVLPFALNSVKKYFTHIGVGSEKRIFIQYREGCPMCAKGPNDSHIIFLSPDDITGCQWVYQFAHEYCHHLIDGRLTGNTAGLKWFEESLCHVASYLCLDYYERVCYNQSPTNSIIIINYLRNLLTDSGTAMYATFMPDKDNPLRREPIPRERIPRIEDFIESRMEVLMTTYSMDDYKKIARMLFPHFYNNDKLWRILPYLGETEEWNSLSDLFDFLMMKANQDYCESLAEMRLCLL